MFGRILAKLMPQSRIKLFGTVLLTLIAGIAAWKTAVTIDQIAWPRSGQDRIEHMATILRRIEKPANWCYPSNNVANVYEFKSRVRGDINACMATIAPASDYIQEGEREYLKRFYRADIGDRFCEVTLSTLYKDNRIVGSDCYFGLFPKEADTGVGMTDDEFG